MAATPPNVQSGMPKLLSHAGATSLEFSTPARLHDNYAGLSAKAKERARHISEYKYFSLAIRARTASIAAEHRVLLENERSSESLLNAKIDVQMRAHVL